MPKSNETIECPVGESSCCWIDEIQNLRQQIADLSELVLTDGLTGLYNFRHFKMVLQAEMDRSKRSGIPTCLVMIDLDHFKAINDTYGHEAGNMVLKHVADILTSELRTTDVICRYGGEEFVVIFPETQLNLAVKVADRIRETIADTPVTSEAGDIFVTASMGASVYMKFGILSLMILSILSINIYMKRRNRAETVSAISITTICTLSQKSVMTSVLCC